MHIHFSSLIEHALSVSDLRVTVNNHALKGHRVQHGKVILYIGDESSDELIFDGDTLIALPFTMPLLIKDIDGRNRTIEIYRVIQHPVKNIDGTLQSNNALVPFFNT